MTRWTADPNDPSDPTKQQGVRQACAEVSGSCDQGLHGEVPVANSPEPNGA